jgi:hypothetical protein
MKTIKWIGHVDEPHRLHAAVPDTLPPGPVQLLVVVPGEEDQDSDAWMRLIAREWAAELSDPREDIYTLEDGEPLHGAR